MFIGRLALTSSEEPVLPAEMHLNVRRCVDVIAVVFLE